MKVQCGQKMRVFALLMETIWTWKFCVAIYLAKSQGEEIMCNLALISSRKKTLKWLLIYHCAHPPPLPPWFNWLCNTELFVSSLDCWKWNQLRWRESFKLSGLLWKDIIRKTYRKWLKNSTISKNTGEPSKSCDDSSGFSSCMTAWWICICRFPD